VVLFARARRDVSLAEEVCAVRRHSGQVSLENINSGALVEENVRLFDEYALCEEYVLQHGGARDTNGQSRLDFVEAI
jgi:hypothetical protein